MSICTPSLKVKCIPICTTIVYIGKVSKLNSDVDVYIKNLTTGRIEIVIGHSDAWGIVKIYISNYTFRDNHSFELWITSVDDQTRMNITIGSSTETSIAICFADINNGVNGYSASSETLSEA